MSLRTSRGEKFLKVLSRASQALKPLHSGLSYGSLGSVGKVGIIAGSLILTEGRWSGSSMSSRSVLSQPYFFCLIWIRWKLTEVRFQQAARDACACYTPCLAMLHERFISVAPKRNAGFHERKGQIRAVIRQIAYIADGGWNTVAIKMQAKRRLRFPSTYRKRPDFNVVGNGGKSRSYII